MHRQADELIRKMKRSKVPLAQIAAQLNSLRIKRESTWTARDIKAYLEAEPAPVPMRDSQWFSDETKKVKVLTMPTFSDWEKDPRDPEEIAADEKAKEMRPWEAIVEQIEQDNAFEERTDNEAPVDFGGREGFFDFSNDKQLAAMDYGRLRPSSKDLWHRGIAPMAARMSAALGYDVHALLDQVKDQGGVKGPLRRATWGLMMQLGLAQETILSLRKRYQPKRYAKIMEATKRPAMTDEEFDKLFKDGRRDRTGGTTPWEERWFNREM